MKNPIIDHSWKKIVEADTLSKVVLENKLKQIAEISEIIESNKGSDAVENVLEAAFLNRALNRCLDFLNQETSEMIRDDYYIYYAYATTRARKAEEIIDTELSHLNL